MNLPDTFYISLCMTILFIGAVYWVWTQIQYVQRKVNALENIVYELKQVCQQSKAPPAVAAAAALAHSYMAPSPHMTSYEPAPEDLLHEALRSQIELTLAAEEAAAAPITYEQEPRDIQTVSFEPEKGEFVFQEMPQEPSITSSGVLNIDEEGSPFMFGSNAQEEENSGVADLQPGGVGSGIVSHSSALETMTLKELRRLANQRGVSGVNDMKKKEIIAAIRALPTIDIFAGLAEEAPATE